MLVLTRGADVETVQFFELHLDNVGLDLKHRHLLLLRSSSFVVAILKLDL